MKIDGEGGLSNYNTVLEYIKTKFNTVEIDCSCAEASKLSHPICYVVENGKEVRLMVRVFQSYEQYSGINTLVYAAQYIGFTS